MWLRGPLFERAFSFAVPIWINGRPYNERHNSGKWEVAMNARWLVGLGVLVVGSVGVVVGAAWGMSNAGVPGWQRKYELQRAPEFLFAAKYGFRFDCAGWPVKLPPGGGSYVTFSPRAPFRQVQETDLNVARKEAPALTLASEMSTFVKIAGEKREDWSVQLCAKGDGDTESEARGRMGRVVMTRMGGLVSVAEQSSGAQPGTTADLLVHAPAEAPATFHLSSGAIEVMDMDGPVRVAAPRGRTKILDTTGRVDATGAMVDFAGAKGAVDLNASTEMNPKFKAARFDGTLSATAERSVRVLVPKGFATPFEVIVSRRDDFACRAEFCSQVKSERQKSGLYFFTYAGDGGAGNIPVHLRSLHGPVVMDTAAE
jgi:hypothetical protein